MKNEIKNFKVPQRVIEVNKVSLGYEIASDGSVGFRDIERFEELTGSKLNMVLPYHRHGGGHWISLVFDTRNNSEVAEPKVYEWDFEHLTTVKEKLEAFKVAFVGLEKVWGQCSPMDGTDGIRDVLDCNYPFEGSFDELSIKVMEWVEESKSGMELPWKTPIPKKIENETEAKAFLKSLYDNNEIYNPEADAHDVVWNLQTGFEPDDEMCDALNHAMNRSFEFIEDPCQFVYGCLEYGMKYDSFVRTKDVVTAQVLSQRYRIPVGDPDHYPYRVHVYCGVGVIEEDVKGSFSLAIENNSYEGRNISELEAHLFEWASREYAQSRSK